MHLQLLSPCTCRFSQHPYPSTGGQGHAHVAHVGRHGCGRVNLKLRHGSELEARTRGTPMWLSTRPLRHSPVHPRHALSKHPLSFSTLDTPLALISLAPSPCALSFSPMHLNLISDAPSPCPAPPCHCPVPSQCTLSFSPTHPHHAASNLSPIQPRHVPHGSLPSNLLRSYKPRYVPPYLEVHWHNFASG